MAIDPKTKDDFIESMKNFITEYNSKNGTNIDIRDGTVFKDLIIDSPSVEFENIYSDITYASKLSSLEYSNEIENSDLDLIGLNYGLTRLGSSISTVDVTFITTSTQDAPPDTNIIINTGVQVKVPSSVGSPEIQFKTIESKQIDVSHLNDYLYTDFDGTKRYAVTVKCSCLTPGSVGNVQTGAIKEIITPITGIGKVTNPSPGIGGRDVESNSDFANRIKEKLSGNSIGTDSGIKALLYTDERVKDINIIRAGDSDAIRNIYGGEVDVIVLKEDRQTYTFQVVYTGPDQKIYFPIKPYIDSPNDVTVIGVKGGSQYTFPVNITKDVGVYKDSIKDSSYLTFKSTDLPDSGSVVSISYPYDKLIVDLQAIIDQNENHIIGSDILIRKAYKKNISLSCALEVYSGYDRNTISDEVNNSLSLYIQNLSLGQKIDYSDLITEISKIDGVDSVTITGQSFPIYTRKNEYIVLTQLTVNIGTDFTKTYSYA